MDPEILAIMDQRKPLRVLVYEAIKEGIIRGVFQPGDRLRHESLAKQLDVSHTPVRQALERLVAEGFADRVPYRGITVARINERELAEVYAFRLMLEPVAVRLAAQNMSERDIVELRRIIEEAKSLVSLDEMNERRRINRDFHNMIISACGRPTLIRILEHIWNRYQTYWLLYEGMFRQPEFLEKQYSQEVEEHLELLSAISDGNGYQAEKLAHDHIEAFLSEYLIGLLGFQSELIESARNDLWPAIGFGETGGTSG